MTIRLVQSILLVLLLTAISIAQVRKEDSRPIQERALRFEPYIIESSKRYGIDARLLRTVCLIESRFRVEAVSPRGARGPMQFMPETARRYGLQNPNDPRAAIDAAAQYLRDLLRKFGGRVDLALAAYNAGEGTVESFRTGKPLLLATGRIINPRGLVTGGVPPYRETQDYVRTILSFFIRQRTNNSQTAAQLRVAQAPRSNSRDFTLDSTDPSQTSAIKSIAPSSFIEIR